MGDELCLGGIVVCMLKGGFHCRASLAKNELLVVARQRDVVKIQYGGKGPSFVYSQG